MYRNPKYLEAQELLSFTDVKKVNRLRLKQLLLMSIDELQGLHPNEFQWFSSDDWFELTERLADFSVQQMNAMFTPQKLKQIPLERLIGLKAELELREDELMQYARMTIVRPVTRLGTLVWAEIEVNILELLDEAMECSKKWYAQKSQKEQLALANIMADEYHLFVDGLMARWKLDRKTVDKYFQVKRLLGYNVIALSEVVSFARNNLRAQTEPTAITREALFFEREENQDNGIETIGNTLIETLFDTQSIIDEIAQDDQLSQLCKELKYFSMDMDKRSFERHLKMGYWEHYRIGVQFRISKRQVLESAINVLNHALHQSSTRIIT